MINRLMHVAVISSVLLVPSWGVAAPVKTAKPETVGMSSMRLANLTNRFQALLDDEKTGGFQILISRRGKIVLYENLGMANVEEEIPVSEETLFRIYSMTKPVVGVAMMMLYEEGHYSLGDPLSMHIPEFAALKVYAGENDDGSLILEAPVREPTVQDLLRHTAGFTYGFFSDTPVDKQYRDQGILGYDDTLQMLINKLAGTPLLYQPGTRWHYSVAVDIQGYLIEKWTGKTVGEFLAARLFKPLGMDQTMAWVTPDDADLLAKVYTHDDEGNRVRFDGEMMLDHLRAPGGFSGGGQLVSTGDDYWRFAQMLLNGGEWNGQRILSPRTVEMMASNRLPDEAEPPEPGSGFGFNVGVITDATRGDVPVSNGEYFWGGLATTVFWVDPEEEMVAILLTQYLPWQGQYYDDLFHRLVRAAIIE
ncbi:MAG: serine hydrolase domain-containing protein [Woeseia sp.]